MYICTVYRSWLTLRRQGRPWMRSSPDTTRSWSWRGASETCTRCSSTSPWRWRLRWRQTLITDDSVASCLLSVWAWSFCLLQGEMVNQIETNIKQSSNYVEKAKKETTEAVVSQRKARKVRTQGANSSEAQLAREPAVCHSPFSLYANQPFCVSSDAEEDLDRHLFGHPHPHHSHRSGVGLHLGPGLWRLADGSNGSQNSPFM